MISQVDRYFKETEQSSDIPHIPVSQAFDPKIAARLDQHIDKLRQSLGVAEQILIERMADNLFDGNKGIREKSIPDIRYAFNSFAGTSYINIMTRLHCHPLSENKIYETFINDALAYKFAGRMIQDSANLFEEGFVFDRTHYPLTWGNFFREVAAHANPNYFSLKLNL